MVKGTFKAMRDNLEGEAELVAALLDLAGGSAPAGFRGEMLDFAQQAKDLSRFIARVEADAIPVRVAVVGDFSSGKSSFINSVLQDPNLCPERADPTTSLVTTFTYGPEERILQHHGDGRITTVSRAQYAAQVQAPHDGSAPVHFTFHLPDPLLRGLELVDTPGFNNRANPSDSQVTTGIMKDADAFFYLVDANTGTIADTGLNQVRQLKQESREAQVFLLISKADLKATEGLMRIKARYRKEHAALFEERILTYSSIETRPDLDDREDLAELFHTFQRDKATLAMGTLKRRLRVHRDLRLTRARLLQEALIEFVDILAEEIKTRGAICLKVFNRLMDVWNDEINNFWAELANAIEVYVKPTEKKGSGFWVDDAYIIFDQVPFRDAVEQFWSFKVIEEALHETIVALFGTTRQDLHRETRERCKAARCECARVAEVTTRSAFGGDLHMRFDSLDKARESYASYFHYRADATAKAAWAEWDTCFEGLCNTFATEFVEAPNEALNRRAETLAAGIDHWKNLIESMPEPTP